MILLSAAWVCCLLLAVQSLAEKLTLTVTTGNQHFTFVEGDGSQVRLPTIDLDSDKTIFSVTNVRQSAEYVLLSLGSIGSFRMPRSDDGKYEFKLEKSGALENLKINLPVAASVIVQGREDMWNLGAVQVKSTPAIPIADSNYEFTVESQPEIQHVFRPEIKSPPVWISTAFAIIVLSPWLQLLKSFVSIGVNLKGFPSGTLGAFVSSTVFTIFLAVSCFVLWLYWVYLNVFQAVLALLGAGVVLALSGRLMLKHFYSINGLSVVV